MYETLKVQIELIDKLEKELQPVFAAIRENSAD